MIKKKSGSWKKASEHRKKASLKKSGSGKKPSAKKRDVHSGKGAKKKYLQKRSRFSVLVLTLGIAIVAGALGYVLLHSDARDSRAIKTKQALETKTPKNHKPQYEIFPVEPARAAIPSKPAQADPPVHRQPSAGDDLPEVAIIIDDIGYDKGLAEKFLNLNGPLTFAILPFSRYSTEIARIADRKGSQVMLHLPMEPNEYPSVDPGKGALLASMTPDERISQLEKNLDAVPHIKGVNNHMGSKLTTLSDEMNQVFSVLKKRGLFFIDSRTSAATQTRSSARLFKVPYAERDVFLDHVQDRGTIRTQIEDLMRIAEVAGRAVGIGHPHDATYEVLAQMMPELKKRVRLVFATDIVEHW
ncbi:MAG: divergent polysaccharide deacetylase family protein [Desulfobacterales bacterium]|jgi:hypothetical protein|nr:divergent polysaccharide deacetylase family protein [Desulfobacterales bacterium]